VHTRNGACNDQALYLRSPFEDCVDPLGATISTSHGTFRREIDPQMSGEDPVWTHLGPIPDPVSESRTSTAVSHEQYLGHAKQVEIP
jgi:hypothetical protein